MYKKCEEEERKTFFGIIQKLGFAHVSTWLSTSFYIVCIYLYYILFFFIKKVVIVWKKAAKGEK